jgi:HAE1 family hydrophobic/amphiphilic exporter-1
VAEPPPPATPAAVEEPEEVLRPAGSFAATRPVAVGVVFLAAVIFGLLSYAKLPVNLMPELTYPTLTVRTEYPGAAPEEVENDISRPIEEALGVIGGLKRISSISRAGVSDVVLELGWGMSMTDAVQDTLERLDQVFLPDEAERPLILRFDPSLDPVLELSLAATGEGFEGEEGLRRLRRMAELEIKRELEPIKGVAAVQVRGGLEEEIHVRLSRLELARTGISSRLVIDRLRQENVNVAGGTLEEGSIEYMVRTLNEFSAVEQIAETIVTRVDDRDIRVKDLGTVERSHRERQITTRTDGHESVQLDVFKEADANMVALSKRIRAVLGTLEAQPEQGEAAALESAAEVGAKPGPRQPQGLAQRLLDEQGARLEIVADRSLFIESSIREVRDSAIFGGLLAILVLYLFLRNGRSTAIVAVSIPASLLITFAPMQLFGLSLNIMSLGGLALGVGMLVDSSIVVLESIFRCREEGDELLPAVVRGTSEVRGAVIASTLTSIAVFLPMVFVEGVAGEAFGDLGLAVVVSLLAALAVALFLIPMLAARQGLDLSAVEDVPPPRVWSLASLRSAKADFAPGTRRWYLAPWVLLRTILWLPAELIGKVLALLVGVVVALALFGGRLVWRLAERLFDPVARALAAAIDRLQGWYRRVLGSLLLRPAAVLVLMVACLALIGRGFASLDSELLPEVHQGEITFELALPAGTPLERTEAILEPIEAAVLEEKAHIRAMITTFGFDPALSQRSDEGEHTARFRLLLDAADPEVEEQVVARLRRRLASVPDLDQRLTRPVLFSFRTPIEVEVHGDDLELLRRQAAEVAGVLEQLPELADVESTLRRGAPEVEIVYDRERLSRAGLSLATVADSVRDLIKGSEASRFNQKDRRIPIMVQLDEGDRRTVDDVGDLIVNPGDARPLPLSAIADIRLGEGPSEVRRVDGRRVAIIRANLSRGTALGAAATAIEETLERRVEWAPGTTWFLSGQNEEWERSAGSLWLALGLSIFLVYVIMAAQFESLLHPLVIMVSIPLAFVGTVVTLELLGMTLSIVVFLGMILLAGIVVNNAIVLVDYVNVLRARGMERREALLMAGAVRLRPILMTTATTVLGLVPMALGLGDGAEIRTPMAIAVISGLVSSTVLTLVVIPVLYEVVEGWVERFRQGRPVEELEMATDLTAADVGR